MKRAALSRSAIDVVNLRLVAATCAAEARRVDFALFMVAALGNDDLVREAPAIVGCRVPSAVECAEAVGV